MKKLILIIVMIFISHDIADSITINDLPKLELIYDDIWGTIYNPVIDQCNDNPTITGDGSTIIPENASEHRWVAISQVMLWCDYRQNLITDNDNRFRGKLRYGDSIWIDSPYVEINGWWEIRDTKNKRYINSIDFLQTIDDDRLYNGDKLWSGKFTDIKIYRLIT